MRNYEIRINFLVTNTWGHACKAEQWIATGDGTRPIALKNPMFVIIVNIADYRPVERMW
jgi:hypothetical protein